MNKDLNDVVNIVNDHETSVLELAEMIIDITGSQSKIIHLPPLKEGDMTRRQPDISKMLALMTRPLTPLREGIKKVIELGHFKDKAYESKKHQNHFQEAIV